MEHKLKISDTGIITYITKSFAYDGVISVHWSDVGNQVDFKNENPHPPFSPICRFWVSHDDHQENYNFHRIGKPAFYEFINGILYQMAWVEHGREIKTKTILDGVCNPKDIHILQLALNAKIFFKKYPRLQNWSKWTINERTLFKLECV